jgi:hypothetical protein
VPGPNQNIFVISAPGTYTLDPSVSFVQVNVAGAVTVILPPANISAAGAQAQPGLVVKNPIIIVDVGGHATANPITVQRSGSDTIMGLTSVAINVNYGGYVFQPIPNLSLYDMVGQFTNTALAGSNIQVGTGGPSAYTMFNIMGNDSNPSLVHNATADLSLNGIGTATAFVMGVSNALTNAPAWMQVRNWFADNNSTALLIQPLSGSVSFFTTDNFGGNGGILCSHKWMNSTYSGTGFSFSDTIGGINIYSPGALFTFGRASDIPAGTMECIQSVSFSDLAAEGAWPIYIESHRMTDTAYCYGTEIAMVNRESHVQDMNPFGVTAGGHGWTIGIQIDSSNSAPLSQYTEYSASCGINIIGNISGTQVNAHGFLHGIIIADSALDSTIYNPPDAIALASGSFQHAISWWSSISNRAWLIYSNATTGNNTLALTNTSLVSSATVVTPASTTARTSLNIPSGTAPTTPNDGDMWYDGANVHFRVGGTTKTFTLT